MIFRSVDGMPSNIRAAFIKIATDRVKVDAWKCEGPLLGATIDAEEYRQALELAADAEYTALVEAWKTQTTKRATAKREDPMEIARTQDVAKRVTLDDVIEVNDGQLIGKTSDGVRVYAIGKSEVALDPGGTQFIVEKADRLIGGQTAAELLAALGEE